MIAVALDAVRPILVLVGFCALIGFLAFDLRAMKRVGWRLAFLQASVIFGSLVWAISEALGSVRAIALAGVLGSWGLVLLAAAVVAIRIVPRRQQRAFREELPRLRAAVGSLPCGARWAIGLVAVLVLVLAATALLAAPNTWDSMTYHLSRVMHWQQDRSLAFFPTNIQRQLAFGPWAEMAMLHLQILAGGDRLASFVQFFALIGCAAGVSLLAERLGGDRRAQALAALLCVSMPMAILQGTSTQNDLVTALWCTTFVVFLLLGRATRRPGFLGLMTGMTAGLAVLTKVTALLYLAPFGAWYVIYAVRALRSRAWRPLLAVAGVAAIVLAPQSLRNYRLYGNALGVAPGPELTGYTNEVLGMGTAVSNVLRNASLQLAVPWQDLNAGSHNLVRTVHALFGLDINDPRTTWQDSRFEVVFSMFEDNAGNPLHAILVMVGLAVLIRFRSTSLVAFELCALVAFLLFCLVLKWQPWNSRLMLPILLLSMAPTGVLLARLLPGAWISGPALVLALAAVPYVLSNPTRPLLGERSILRVDRTLQYFANVPDDPGTYFEAARLISDSACDRIGLASPPEGREYLLWVVNQMHQRPIQIEHILVKNASRRYSAEFRPCAVVVTYPYSDSTLRLDELTFEKTISTERFSLFLPKGIPP